MVPKAQVSEPQEPGQEKALPAGELEAGEELAAVCAAAYTVCARSPGTGDPGVSSPCCVRLSPCLDAG